MWDARPLAFTVYTITYKVVVYAPAERVDIPPLFLPVSVPSSELGPPVLLPHWTQKGEQHSLAVEGVGAQFGRLERKPDTLYTLWTISSLCTLWSVGGPLGNGQILSADHINVSAKHDAWRTGTLHVVTALSYAADITTFRGGTST